jgi:ABC-2 type transport system permease protein
MSVAVNAGRAGVVRGRIELRQTFTNTQDLWAYLFPAVVLTVVMVFMRGSTVPGMGVSLSSLTLPSVLGMNIAFGGLVNLAQQLVVEREGGTLLRAKAILNGMLGYLVGKIVQVSGMSLIGSALVQIPGLFLAMPLGAIVGSLLSSPRSMGIVMLPMMGLIAISGIFYPITSLPSGLRSVGQVFPIYWLGLGTRSALLPDAMSAVEIGHSWRHLETVGVLGVWAVAGLIIAPMVSRRMARRESGSAVAARRERALQRMPR